MATVTHIDTSASTACSTWTVWTNTSTGSTTVTDTWYDWTTTAAGTGDDVSMTSTTWGNWQFVYAQEEPTRLARRERRRRAIADKERNRQAAQQADEEATRRRIAEEKAEALLASCLTHEQEQAWKEDRAIFVTGQSGKRFEIVKGRAHNIFELDEKGKRIAKYCVHPQPHLPDADNVLSQKLGLEYNEAHLLELANRWNI